MTISKCMASNGSPVLLPEPLLRGRQYLAGYEVYVDGHPFWWGHLAVLIEDGDPLLAEPQGLLDLLCSMAAQRHDVAPAQVRLKMVSRL
ncbi:hypothetical protein ABB26_09505 [Stenotrophomonas humi]|uniref:Uncharacterized protein n=1 Tax=Stenotrophomonas humi TaxID=405444 RepID=A0A0R0C4G9_9GAMM|nr:hypothetical protein [Stenotrophomonas humi]KRG64086.1 hypothetical protein ABB26_09505 [Stenotrophomonas humi]